MLDQIVRFLTLVVVIAFVWIGCSDDSIAPSTTSTTTGTTTSSATTGSATGSGTSGSTTSGATTSTTGATTGATTSTTSGSTTGGSTTSGTNYYPSFELTWNDSVIVATSFLADYGEKIYISGLDKNSNLVIDFALPAKKGQLILDKPFSFEDKLDHAKGIFYIQSDQWAIVDGKVSITKHSNSRIEGTFSGKAYLYDYASGMPQAIDSAIIRNGKFKDIYIKG
ncbi:MAG: hypothetical protein H6606_04140 [Flavobacteriales bacterium]|nr:hypothetical protein [Flavobacteriales bacterium]